MVSERSYPPSRRVREELEVIERSSALVEAGEDSRPSCLSLVAMCELDVRVREGSVGFGQLLEPNDRDVRRRTRPRVVLNELASDAGVPLSMSMSVQQKVMGLTGSGERNTRFVFGVVEYSLFVALY